MCIRDRIPDDLKHAVVAMEDRRFYKHRGVDFKSIARAALNNLVTSSTQGGSTIDMQVSKNLLTSEDKTYKRKVRDMYNAIQTVSYTHLIKRKEPRLKMSY